MSTNIAKEVLGVRSLLDSPLDQSPSFEDILGELEAEYQHITNELNAKGDAWHIESYTLTTVADQYEYQLTYPAKSVTIDTVAGSNQVVANSTDFDYSDIGRTITFNDPSSRDFRITRVVSTTTVELNEVVNQTQNGINADLEAQGLKDFYKALSVTSVPENVRADPQYILEFTELEHIPRAWQWLSPGKGQYMESSHDSQIIAFYRKMGRYGEELWVQLRPIPEQAQDYKILYQKSEWWDQLFSPDDYLDYVPPHSSQRFYIRCMVALNLLYRGSVRWSYNGPANEAKARIIAEGLEKRAARYLKTFESYKSSLDHPDITYVIPWADELGMD